MLENQENKGEKYTLLKFKLSFVFFLISNSHYLLTFYLILVFIIS